MQAPAALIEDTPDRSEAWERTKAKLILTPLEAAKELSVHVNTLAKIRIAGSGPKFIRLAPHKIGYRMSDLEAFLESRVRTSTAQD